MKCKNCKNSMSHMVTGHNPANLQRGTQYYLCGVCGKVQDEDYGDSNNKTIVYWSGGKLHTAHIDEGIRVRPMYQNAHVITNQ